MLATEKAGYVNIKTVSHPETFFFFFFLQFKRTGSFATERKTFPKESYHLFWASETQHLYLIDTNLQPFNK